MRQWRAATESMKVEPLDKGEAFYGAFAVRPKTTLNPYRVEIRALDRRDNSCTCPDFRVNGLGTCKHVEAVLARLWQKGPRAFTAAVESGPSCAEVYLLRTGMPEVRLLMPSRAPRAARTFFGPFFGADGRLLGAPASAVPALLRTWKTAPAAVHQCARISAEIEEWNAELARRAAQMQARTDFLGDVTAGKRTLDVVRHILYPYQQEGMLHLVFGERALLADEMGLGKTVQAVAACELLRQLRGIERVLVVSPASLKAEWEEQIAKFTGLPAKVVWGKRQDRLKAYQEKSFFYLTNYEQARADVAEMNRLVAPDVVILDEAQRIKNWQTQTAQRIKQLSSPYAFVLTGTPLENRIDEVYSIAQFLDPTVFGPLFRFNREFYDLDESGRPKGLKNLPELHRRLRPIMLRRRKDQVEEQLPERTIKNHLVGMEKEQRVRYAEFEFEAAKLIAIAKRRPLRPEEMERLQRFLACMRMVCDTPYILDAECRLCPKLGELAEILQEVVAGGDSKVIVFSEWERMLQLVRNLADEMKLDYAWHTGSVPQQKRRVDINRFKQDPACRLFLSTDSGATGLNLQAANVVINLDLPWNPAKLEQRIARAWRKHQTRAVRVINLVCEDSIEHRMLTTLAQKQQLADGVLDGRGDLENIKLPSGRAAFMERLQSLMGDKPAAPPMATAPAKAAVTIPPETVFRQDLVARLGSRLAALECRVDAEGRDVFLAVVDSPAEQTRPLAERLLRDAFEKSPSIPELELVDRTTFETIRRLIERGVLKPSATTRVLHGEETTAETGRAARARRLAEARKAMEQADRKRRMSEVLNDGGFAIEAAPAIRDAVEWSLKTLLCLAQEGATAEGPEVPLPALKTVRNDLVPVDFAESVTRFRALAASPAPLDEAMARELLDSGIGLVDHAQKALARAALA
jgi:hypothetical protein